MGKLLHAHNQQNIRMDYNMNHLLLFFGFKALNWLKYGKKHECTDSELDKQIHLQKNPVLQL